MMQKQISQSKTILSFSNTPGTLYGSLSMQTEKLNAEFCIKFIYRYLYVFVKLKPKKKIALTKQF